MAANGQIEPNTLIWDENLASWTAASAVPGVFNSGTQTASSPYSAPAIAQAAPLGGQYPIPKVKKTLLSSKYSGGAGAAAARAAIAITMKIKKMSVAETEEEIFEAREAIDKKYEINKNTDSGGSAAGLGAGIGGLVLGWIISVFAAIYAYIILYRAWCILQPGGARTTPGQAVGFCFIPFFNIYWIFNVYAGWATDWTRIRSSYSNLQGAPQASSGMFIAAFVCMITVILMPVGIIFMICKKKMCDTINYCAANQAGALPASL